MLQVIAGQTDRLHKIIYACSRICKREGRCTYLLASDIRTRAVRIDPTVPHHTHPSNPPFVQYFNKLNVDLMQFTEDLVNINKELLH